MPDVPTLSTHSWRFFYRPRETWEAMYEDCQRALNSIEFEQYILENDPVGRRFMELFIEKAKEGIKVFLICDTFGSSLLQRSPLVRELRRHGGRIHFYNTLTKWMMITPWRWFPRTHTKTLLIDSAVAYTGGVCMAERMRDWRDTHIRVTGPVIGQIRQAFDDIERRILRKRSRGIPPPHQESRFLYFVSRPFQKRCAVYRELVKTINSAERYIYITSAFFLPNQRFIRCLKQAHKRGVDIKVLVPEYSDVLLADWLRLSYTPRFLKAGLRLFHYQDTVLHSKTAIVDDRWGTVGSTNFDVISFFHNREGNIITTEPEAVDQLKQRFFEDLRSSEELTWEKWRQVPLWKKIAGYSARPIKAFFG